MYGDARFNVMFSYCSIAESLGMCILDNINMEVEMPLSKQAALNKDKTTGLAPMQHRHFATIATIIRDSNNAAHRHYMANVFADRLGETNPNFDRERFTSACED